MYQIIIGRNESSSSYIDMARATFISIKGVVHFMKHLKPLHKIGFVVFILFYLGNAFAIDLPLDNTIVKTNGDQSLNTCLTGDIYRLGTTATYNGQALDVLVEITAEDNEYDTLTNPTGGRPCIGVAGGILETALRDRDVQNGNNSPQAFMDLKITVVQQGTSNPVEVDRITFSGFDLDTNGAPTTSIYYTGTDDIYMIAPSRGYIQSGGASNVTYNEGAYGASYDVQLQGQTTGNCTDSAANPDPSCRGGGIAVYGPNGPNRVTSVNIRVSNDSAYANIPIGDYYDERAYRLIQISFKELDFEAILSSSVDHGDIPVSYQDASHDVTVFTVLGYGEPADSENAQYSTNADADDTDPAGQNYDDESDLELDGVLVTSTQLDLTLGATHTLDVTTIGTGYLSAWIDMDISGNFDDTAGSTEILLDDVLLSSTIAIKTPILITVPTTNASGTSYVRFRFSENIGTGPTGYAGKGEVEDYKVVFLPGGDIAGHLYIDTNQNGIQDAGEPNLANVDVIITDNIGATTTVQTNANGDYLATAIRAGNASVNIDTSDPDFPSGAIQTEGTNPTVVTVNPNVVNTEENNGFFVPGTVSGSVKNQDNNGLSAVTVEIHDSSGNIINDTNGNPLTTTTDGSGNYSFSNVPAGNYEIVEIDPAGYVSTADGDISTDSDANANSSQVDNIIPVSIVSAKNDTGNNFVDAAVGSVAGSVKDSNNNPLGLVTIEIRDLSNNIVNDIYGNPLTTTTAADGSYSFSNVPAGNYNIVETDPAGYVSTIDGDTSPDADANANTSQSDNKIPLTIIAGKNDIDNNFVDTAVGSIAGSVKDLTNSGINNVTIEIRDLSNNIVNDAYGNPLTTTTTPDGSYSFSNVPLGDYNIIEVDPATYISMSDGDSSDDADSNANTNTNDNKIPVTLTLAENDIDNNFVDSQEADLSITKVADEKGPEVGEQVIYTITVTNNGPIAATNVVVVDSLGFGLAFDSSNGCAEDPNAMPNCSLGSIANGANKSYTVTIDIMDTGAAGAADDYNDVRNNTVNVSADQPDTNIANNQASEDITVSGLELIKLVCNQSLNPACNYPADYTDIGNGKPNDILQYRIDYKRYGIAAFDVIIDDTIPTNSDLKLNSYSGNTEVSLFCPNTANIFVETGPVAAINIDLANECVLNTATRADGVTVSEALLQNETGYLLFKVTIK